MKGMDVMSGDKTFCSLSPFEAKTPIRKAANPE